MHNDVLSFEDRFSLAEKRMESGFSDAMLSEIIPACQNTLAAVLMLEQMAAEQASRNFRQHSSEIEKLEHKIDFLTELMANVILAQNKLPAKQSIRMSSSDIAWNPATDLREGDYCLLSIYLTRKYPLPLELPVIVQRRLGGSRVEAQILISDEQVKDDLTRLVFLYHRRYIAKKKSSS